MRRDLSKGQRAIIAAEAWELEVRDKSVTTMSRADRRRYAKAFGIAEGYVQQARALVERAPKAAQKVSR